MRGRREGALIARRVRQGNVLGPLLLPSSSKAFPRLCAGLALVTLGGRGMPKVMLPLYADDVLAPFGFPTCLREVWELLETLFCDRA